jgi:diguanylate cyclase (GGDEF)-like protein
MGKDETVARRDPPIRVETLHESERTRVTRLFLPDGSVVRKEVFGPDRDRRLRHELNVLQRLSGVPGVAQLAHAGGYEGSIMLEDVDGVCLAGRTMPLPSGELLDVALGLARALAEMHRNGVVHRDICPANVVLSGSGGVPILVDFALATSLAEIRPEFAHPSEIVGTLAYMAPEQTGRTGRPVDERADLYGLGVTLYELATGAPPFGDGDPLKLIHAHVAQVPRPPAILNPAVPAQLSDVIMHLLEKEPDNRYQTADGLIHDLSRIHDATRSLPGRTGGHTPMRIGEHDFPMRLLAPSRLVGREAEIASLGEAFSDATNGQRHGVLISGAPGVGKTSLIDELRPVAAANDGWFVSGKFDQYRRDQEFDGVLQAFRSLGRLLLAEPEDQLAELRERILRVLGSNAGLVSAVIPEFSALLGVPPDPGDPLTAQVRMERGAVAILRAVASRKRPVVFVVDDLQWATRTPLGFIDLVMSEEDLDGLLMVGAYRADEVDAAHPLTAMLSRWRRQPSEPEHLRLQNLPPPSLSAMVADMLRLNAEHAAEFARTIVPHTNGNPYDTVELLNALRRHGILAPTTQGWRWDASALAGYLGATNIVDMLTERSDALPPATRDTLEAMACLGGRAELRLLGAATGHSAAVLEARLAPALDDGLLVMQPGHHEAVRFRHDRLREAILLRLTPHRRKALGLGIARRLAAMPDLFAVAAEQYLQVLDALGNADEQSAVAGLLRRAADQAKLLSNHALVERLSAAAVRLTDPADTAALIALQTRRHAALYSLGRLDEADEIYRLIDGLCTTPAQRVDPTIVQVKSLTHRIRYREAIGLGVHLLRLLGVQVPGTDHVAAQIDQRLDALYHWLDQTSEAEDLSRPTIADSELLATSSVINSVLPATYFAEDRSTLAWLSLEALRVWAVDGPDRTLIGPASAVVLVTIDRRQDYCGGYRALRRLLASGEARRYETETSQARFTYAFFGCHWCEPLEEGVRQAERAREGLLQGGDLTNAGYTYSATALLLQDCAPTLDDYLADVEEGAAFARRARIEMMNDSLAVSRWLIQILRGGGDGPSDDVATPGRYTHNPQVVVISHVTRALAAAVFGDLPELTRHAAAVMPRLSAMTGTYVTAMAHLLRALALAGEVRVAAAAERAALLGELDAVIEWLSLRAADAPDNFLHLLRLVEAERAWAAGDFRAAAFGFHAAQDEVATRQRPWHRALILEHAAQFYLAHGMEHIGNPLLTQARQQYLDWGATAKVEQLDWAHPTLQGSTEVESGQRVATARRRSNIATGAIDLLGILTASRALSSETSIDGLRTRVEEILGAMTGATGIRLLLRGENDNHWLMSTLRNIDGKGTIPIDEPGHKPLVPLSAIRYAERLREPLVVSDATRDDRFSRDPYFTDIECCSLMAIPLLNRGELQALLLLENRLIRGAFSTERLDGVMLIAGQLAVSLGNAVVYASLEHKVAERTHELAIANAQLEVLSITDPLTGLANRRQLGDILDVEWRQAQRSGRPIALAMVDIDHFKLFNDRYGHAAGDKCLQHVAGQLRRGTRDGDLVARYGGEEFAVVMPDTDTAAAIRIAERLRTAIATLAVPDTPATKPSITISVGVGATVPRPDATAASLVEVADAELYRAKRSGRNRVHAAVPGVLY